MLRNNIVSVLLFALLLATVQTVHAELTTAASNDTQAALCGPPPIGGVLATFRTAGGETFRAYITNSTSIFDAITLWRKPETRKRIPLGRLNCTPARWNCPWHWHQVPSSVVFAEQTIEVCDGIPSHVERNCPTFGMGYFCPWSAVMIELRDCRVSSSCPIIPR